MCTPSEGNAEPTGDPFLLHTVKSVGNVQPADNGQMGAGGDCHRRVRARRVGSEHKYELLRAVKLEMDRCV